MRFSNASCARHRLDLKRLQQERSAGGSGRRPSGSKDEETLIASVGYGKITTRQVLGSCCRSRRDGCRSGSATRGCCASSSAGWQGDGPGVKVSGVDDVLVRFGKCCDPLPGERIPRLHHARSRRHGACRTTARACWRATRNAVSRWSGRAAAPRPVRPGSRCAVIDKPGMLAAITKSIGSCRRQHQQRAGAEHARRTGGQPLRGQRRDADPAERCDARDRQATRRHQRPPRPKLENRGAGSRHRNPGATWVPVGARLHRGTCDFELGTWDLGLWTRGSAAS